MGDLTLIFYAKPPFFNLLLLYFLALKLRNMKSASLFIISIFFLIPTKAQDLPLGEIVPSNFKEITVFNTTTYRDSSIKYGKKDLSLKLPPALSQEPLQTCWAFASTYSLISYIDNIYKKDNYFLKSNQTPDLSKIKSPKLPVALFFANTPYCSNKANSKNLLDSALHKYGSISWESFPYDGGCSNNVPTAIVTAAKRNIKKEYDVEVIEKSNLDKVRQTLDQGQPLIISIKIDINFNRIPYTDTAEFVPMWSDFESCASNCDHAMTIVGYNDSIKAVKVLNSYGDDWGNKGYFWISYKLIKEQANYYCYPVNRKSNSTKLDPKKHETTADLSDFTETQLTSWIRAGYYRRFGAIRIGVCLLDTLNAFALIKISNNKGKPLTTFYIDNKSTKSFYALGKRYELSFTGIGNPRRNALRKAMFFSIHSIDDY